MDKILLAHGSGGRLTHTLIRDLMLSEFQNTFLAPLGDAALLDLESPRILFTTDGFTVKPLVFPGGDIGKLSIFGTVNDLAVMGGIPRFLSCSFIIEEGLPVATLRDIVRSMNEAARKAGVQIVTGDTKVVEHGNADKLYITTTGIGIAHRSIPSGEPSPGDAVLINGPVGDHGIAVLSAREDLALESPVASDCAPLHSMIIALLDEGLHIRFMRDPTRGGLATVANELVENRSFSIRLFESRIPIRREVAAICDLLGFDPLYVANEGKVLIVIDGKEAGRALDIMKRFPEGKESCAIGEIIDKPAGRALLATDVGGTRILDMLTGDQLPRIC